MARYETTARADQREEEARTQTVTRREGGSKRSEGELSALRFSRTSPSPNMSKNKIPWPQDVGGSRFDTAKHSDKTSSNLGFIVS